MPTPNTALPYLNPVDSALYIINSFAHLARSSLCAVPTATPEARDRAIQAALKAAEEALHAASTAMPLLPPATRRHRLDCIKDDWFIVLHTAETLRDAYAETALPQRAHDAAAAIRATCP